MDLSSITGNVGMVLGVAFLRNVYMVMSYTSIESGSVKPTKNSDIQQLANADISPYLGVFGLTDINVALKEFHTVRVLQQPLSTPTPSPNGNNDTGASPDGKGISVGIIALIAIVGFFAVCGILFGLRWFFGRRRWKEEANAEPSKEIKGSHELASLNTENADQSLGGTIIGSHQTKGSDFTLSSTRTKHDASYDEGEKFVNQQPNDDNDAWHSRYQSVDDNQELHRSYTPSRVSTRSTSIPRSLASKSPTTSHPEPTYSVYESIMTPSPIAESPRSPIAFDDTNAGMAGVGASRGYLDSGLGRHSFGNPLDGGQQNIQHDHSADAYEH